MSLPAASTNFSELTVGSLTYTKSSLVKLFLWLIWGDICFMLMEGVIPSILPLEFEKLHASNVVIALILTTIPNVIGSIVNPIVSFKSDRHRSNWGRRIPFIVYTMPFLVMAIIGMGYYDHIASLIFPLVASKHFVYWTVSTNGHHGTLRDSIGGAGRLSIGNNWVTVHKIEITRRLVDLTAIGVFMVAFAYFNSFVGAVFWYLFNDVVPEHLLARFMSLFRVVSMATSAAYNFFIFRYADHHAPQILLFCGLVYFFGFGLMCVNVKEGRYPAPPVNIGGERGGLSAIRTFFKECLSIPHYWYVFLASCFMSVANAMTAFQIMFYQSTGLNVRLIGDVTGCSSVGIMLLIPFSGWLADRFHPLRVVVAGYLVTLLLTIPALSIFLVWHPVVMSAYWYWVVFQLVFFGTSQALLGVYDPPVFMVIFPRSRYGQYCSANAMLRSIAGIVGSIAAGAFLDWAGSFMPHRDVYRLMPIWQFTFVVPAFVCVILLYRSWKHFGGDNFYRPPVPGESDEQYAQTEIIENVEAAT